MPWNSGEWSAGIVLPAVSRIYRKSDSSELDGEHITYEFLERAEEYKDRMEGDKNVVIEYYEKHHKNDREYDKKRKQEIIDELECKFIEIYEEGFTKVNWR